MARHHQSNTSGGRQRSNRRDVSKLRNRSHPYVSGLLRTFQPKGPTTADLKAETSDLIDFVIGAASPYPHTERKLYGIPFPQSYDDFLERLPTENANSIGDELRWTAILLRRRHETINSFLVEKHKFEAAVVVGDLETAEAAFDRVLVSYGVSLWTIESGLLLAELKGGIKENRKIQTAISDATGDYLAKMISQFSSHRVEQSVSCAAYRSDIYSLLDDFVSGENLFTYIAYFLLKARYFDFRRFTDSNLLEILNLESTYSL